MYAIRAGRGWNQQTQINDNTMKQQQVNNIIGELDPNQSQCFQCKQYKYEKEIYLPFMFTFSQYGICMDCVAIVGDADYDTLLQPRYMSNSNFESLIARVSNAYVGTRG